eukprot:TRINITY_DN4160_c0_g1_i1.p1 TRINITY_DN4160_c0_g1~~TRINITY_DN4160_c0_g1_i1.p1  ORF type:complete len:598 (+),score=203.94 TRINITY_DN4160_c0_g1_i1:77-1795(+)
MASSARSQSQTSIKSVAETVLKAGVGAVSEMFDDVATLMDAERPDHLAPQKPLRTSAVVFNLSNTTMGVGILTLALTFADAGLVLGPLAMVLCAIATHFSVKMLCRIVCINRAHSDSSGVASLESLAEYCMGRAGKYWIQMILVVICIGTQIAYLVSLKSLLYPGIIHLVSKETKHALEDAHLNQANCMLIVLLLISLPLSFLKRIDALAFTSFLSVTAIVYFVIISVVDLAEGNAPAPCEELLRQHNDTTLPDAPVGMAPPSAIGLLSAFNIISISYICQLTVVPILKELSKGQQYGAAAVPVQAASKQLETAMWITMLIACVLYSGAGFSGYIEWRQLTTKPSTILACYEPSRPAILIVYFGMSVMLAFSYPLIGFTCRQTLQHLIWPDQPALDLKRHVGLTIAIACVCVPVAYFASQLSDVLAVISAVTTPSLCYLLPGVWYVRAHQLEVEDYAKEQAKNAGDGKLKERTEKSPLIVTPTDASFDPPPKDPHAHGESHPPSALAPNANANAEEGYLGYMTRDEINFMMKEREFIRNHPGQGWVMIALGGTMQVACVVAVSLKLAGVADS